MAKRPTISLAMILKNEAHHLPKLKASIEGCFDEIHVTDTGSNDGTIEICQSYGWNVHHFKWVDDFSAARNASFEPVKTDFVFWMDGDDVLSNREAFINWRNDAMEFADYWMAPYHYSLDKSGNSLCTFARERAFKVEKGMRWRYFVHEGVTPESQFGPVRPDYIGTWAIKHIRTESDINADRSRNLKIFEKNLHRMDARARYYYGKELFENQNPMDGFKHLVDAIADPDLEAHDRILGIQYACYAAMACNQFQRAIQLAYQGLSLAPNRAEFHVIIGDCQLKLGRLHDAVPSFSAAKSCFNASPQGSNMAGPIFTTHDAYGPYPRNQLARIFANIGDFPRAKEEARQCFSTYNHPESKQILDEVEKYENIVSINVAAKPCDDIVVTSPPQGAYPWDGELALSKGMGGSETAAIEMAQWLHKLSGRPVKVFNPRGESKTFAGVEYISCQKAPEYFQKNKPFMHIAWRHNIKVTDAPTFLWGHDLITPGAENHDNYLKMLCLTPFHARYTTARSGVPASKIHLTRNGIKPERFMTQKTKNPNKIIFPSSPDRGLDRAILVVDRLKEEFPDLELHVFYGFDNMRKFGQADRADHLQKMCDERSWVKYHGFTQQDVLTDHFKESALWLHPCDFIETSCISAMEILACGVYPVTRRLGGLQDTLRNAELSGMATLIDTDCVTESEFQAYTEAARTALREKRWEKVSVDANELSWEKVAQSWLEELPKYFESEEARQLTKGVGNGKSDQDDSIGASAS